jgi:DNA-binding IclR family transcriptional regulator
VLARLITAGAPFSSAELADLAGVSRQAVHKHLKPLVEAGRLRSSGKARAARYTPVVPLRQRVEVASAGSKYRLSARLLMLDVHARLHRRRRAG